MSDINKINNNPYEVRVTQPSADRRQQRDTTVNDQSSKDGKTPSKGAPKKGAPEKTRESSAMDEMLETLRGQQLEEDVSEYVMRRKERYLESNRQASEEYIKNLKDAAKGHEKRELKERTQTGDAHEAYHNRIQDISRAHIQKLMKSKLEDSSFKDIKRAVDPDDPNPANEPDKGARRAGKLDTSRLRPEVARLLERRQQDQSEKEGPGKGPAQEAEPEGRNLLESALGKLKSRLGGAHKGPGAALSEEFKPVFAEGEAPRGQYDESQAQAPIRADLKQMQASIQRSRALRAAADGSQYVPLDDGDVQKMLMEQKLPVDYATVQAIKVASRRLQDSSYYFQRAVTLLAHSGLSIDAETVDTVTDSLRQFEKYQRPSIMNKLFRFLSARKFMQVYQQLRAQEGSRAAGGQIELGEALLNRGEGARRTLTPRAASAAVEGLHLPEHVDEKTLKGAIGHLLKDLGLPASKVMVNQLAQSAQGNTIRAMALVFQLAARRSLHPDEVTLLQQRLEALPPEARQSTPRALMEQLGLPLPAAPSARSTTQALLGTLMRQLGIGSQQLEAHPLSREAILLLHELGERTETVQELIPRLSEAVKAKPEAWLARLAEHHPRLKALLEAGPGRIAHDQKQTFLQTLMLALELPASRTRAMNRVEAQLEATRSPAGQTVLVEPEVVAQPSPDGSQEAGQTAAQNLDPDAVPAQKSGSAPQAAAPQGPAAQSANPQTAAPSTGQYQAAAASQPQATQASANQPQAAQSTAPGAASTDQTGMAAATTAAAGSSQTAAAAGAGLRPQALAGSDPAAESEFLTQLPELTPELESAFPLAREAILLLRLQGERSNQLGELLPRLKHLLGQVPESTLRQLERMRPALQDWVRHSAPMRDTFQHVLAQLEAEALPATRAEAASAAPRQADHPLERMLLRHYPDLPGASLDMARSKLLGASPATIEGFFQLHRLVGMLDPGKAQSLAGLWQQPQIYARLGQLGPVLLPVLEAVSLSPERRYLSPPTLQNQLLQGVQSWLLQGRPEALQAALQAWLQPLQSPRSPLGKLKEQLAGFGIEHPPEPLLEEIWTLSGGSSDQIDAMAILLRGGYPLIRPNLEQMLAAIDQMPPSLRRQGVSDILMHLSPKLLKLIDQQIESRSDLGQLGSLLEHDLPLLPGNWDRVAASPKLPEFANGLQLSELRGMLQQVRQLGDSLPPAAMQDLEGFEHLLNQLQTQLRALPNLSPEASQAPALKGLSEIMRQLLSSTPGNPLGNPQALRPPAPGQPAQAAAAQTASPATAWVQMLQPLLSREQPALLMQIQDQLSGLFYQVRTLLPKLEARSELPLETVPASPDKLPKTLPPANAPPPDESLAAIEAHLQNWGLKVSSPALLQQIQQLMEGSHERLDAMAVLLKGQMPLLPAHISIVAQYVRNLPPSERFTSISKILSFLSDELIQRMQQELSSERETMRGELMPELEPEQAETAEHLLQSSRLPVTEQRFQAARLLSGSPLPAQPGVLQAITHLITARHQPQQWLAPLQQLLGQMQSLLPNQFGPQAQTLGQLQQTLGEALQLLQPKNPQLANWLSEVGGQLNSVSERLGEQVRSLGADTGVEDHWLGQILASLLGLCSWLEDEEPQLHDQIRRYRSQLREQMPGLRQSFESLAFLHGAEAQLAAAQQPGTPAPQTQYLPALIQSLGYPVEILVRDEAEADGDQGQRGQDVMLTVQTHTLGQVYLSLAFGSGGLRIRIGLERPELQRWLTPYLEALQQKLEHLPWQVAPVQTYVMPAERAHAPVMAQHLYRKYGRRKVEGI